MRKIEVIEPLTFAWENMVKVLFEPFDLGKWLVIGFAAFLTSCGQSNFGTNFNAGGDLFGGGGGGGGAGGGGAGGGGFPAPGPGGGFPPPGGGGGGGGGGVFPAVGGVDPFFISLIVGGAILVIGIYCLALWLGCRGQFIFMHCIAQNDAQIVKPWSEYARPADSLFLLRLAIVAALWLWLLLVGGVLALVFWSDINAGDDTAIVTAAVMAVVLILPVVLLTLALNFAAVHLFGPVMYSRSLTATEAWPIVKNEMVYATFWPVAGLLGMHILLAIAAGIVTQILCCATCSIGVWPYIGAVTTLPITMLLMGYSMRFVEQYGFMMFRREGNLEVCPQCQYDLRGNPAAESCPECGFNLDENRLVCPVCDMDLSAYPHAQHCPHCSQNLLELHPITRAQAKRERGGRTLPPSPPPAQGPIDLSPPPPPSQGGPPPPPQP